MSTTLTFYFDYTSPYSYLASTAVEATAAKIGAELVWAPTFLAAVMKATGNQPPATVERKGKYMARDLARWADVYGVEMHWTQHFPLASQHAMRGTLAVLASDPAKGAALAKALFRAAWVTCDDIGDRSVLARIAESVGADGALVAGATDDVRWKDALKETTERAVSLGAFGVPAFEYEGELYFGNDRLEMIEARAKRSGWSKLTGSDGSPMW